YNDNNNNDNNNNDNDDENNYDDDNDNDNNDDDNNDDDDDSDGGNNNDGDNNDGDDNNDEIAQNNASSSKSPLNASSSVGLPIRAATDFAKLGVPKKASENVRRVLRREAPSWPDSPPPHTLTIRASILESYLPLVSANISLYGLDASTDDPYVSLTQAQLLWDTGAHSTLIVDELLPEAFKEYLTKPENDCYRSASGTRVQLDALIVFSNQILPISCVCVVVPRSVIADSRVGILFVESSMSNGVIPKQLFSNSLYNKPEFQAVRSPTEGVGSKASSLSPSSRSTSPAGILPPPMGPPFVPLKLRVPPPTLVSNIPGPKLASSADQPLPSETFTSRSKVFEQSQNDRQDPPIQRPTERH
ncbi:hypothetical protein MMC31_004660, partial [Peltigera leucophlebia]|nr:hypothetical protein [Peltigera leucophlebia]